MDTKRIIQRINKTKTWFFGKINKINKPLAKLTQIKREKMLINIIRGKKEDYHNKYQ
jgi:hypothetical protein